MTHRIQRAGFVNVYLVEEDDGLTLIDTSIGGGAKAIVAAAEKLGKPIVRIALTHAHGDHIGSLDALHEQVPEAEILISARDARLLKKDKSLDEGEPRGKIKGSSARRQDRADADPGTAATPSARCRSSHRPGTRRATSHSSTRATGRCTAATSSLTWGGAIATTAVFNPRFPLGDAGDVGPPDRGRQRTGAAGARSQGASARPRQGHRQPGGRHGRGDRKGRAGVTTAEARANRAGTRSGG